MRPVPEEEGLYVPTMVKITAVLYVHAYALVFGEMCLQEIERILVVRIRFRRLVCWMRSE